MIFHYTVVGMTCQHCVNHVSEAVGAVAGVENVALSLDGQLAITAAAAPALAVLSEAVAEAGDYTISPVA